VTTQTSSYTSVEDVLHDACGAVNSLARNVIALANLNRRDKDVERATQETMLRLEGAFMLLNAIYVFDEIPPKTLRLWTSAKKAVAGE